MLSRGFVQIEKRSSSVYKRFKSMLPRRESERKLHALARHCDILSAIDTRISMLNMTYMKYIDNNLICFIPGKVLDEVRSILDVIESGVAPPRTHELLQELRDISSMAMEHFDEHILPRLNKTQASQSHSSFSFVPAAKSISKLLVAQTTEIRKMKKKNMLQCQQIQVLTQQIQKLSRKVKRQNVRLKAQYNKIREQDSKIQSNQTKISEHESTMGDLKRQMEEWDQKIGELTAEMNRAREEAQKCVSGPQKALALPEPAQLVSEALLFRPTVKPRMSHITLPAATREFLRKRQSTMAMAAEAAPNKVQKSSEHISTLINENITKNISKAITDRFGSDEAVVKPKPPSQQSERKSSSFFRTPNFSQFISTSMESLLQNPINSIKARKRKYSELSI